MADSSGKPDQPSSTPPNADKCVKLDTHPLVAKMLPPGGAAPNLVALTGYIGPSQKSGSVRLYTGLDFSSYYEIPTAAVAHTEATDSADENSPTTVYVQADAKIDLVQLTTQTVEASFLQGPISSEHLATAAAAPAAGAAPIQPTPTAIPSVLCTTPVQCPRTLPRPVCTEVISVCGPCVTRDPENCTAISVCGPCVTRFQQNCTIVVSACVICPTRTVVHSLCVPCFTSPVVCRQTVPAACTHVGICPSSPVICTETIGPSRQFICPSSPVICTETIPVTPTFPPPISNACTPPFGGGGNPAG